MSEMASSFSHASAEVKRALQQLEAASTNSKAAGYNELLEKIISNSSSPDTISANLTAYVESLLGNSLGIVASRPLLSAFVERFKSIPDPDVKIEVGQRVLELLQPKVVSYEQQDNDIKLTLADAFEQQEDWTASAKILQAVSLDSQQRTITADDKAKLWMRIVRCYIEDDDPTSASGTLNRVKTVIHDVTSKETRLMFQLSQARILDSQRQFLDASSAYFAISLENIIDEEERKMALSSAISCAILAPAGPKRGRQLAKLYKDERAQEIEEYSILEKIFLDRLLSPEEVNAFADKLQDHQKAKTSDGSTVLEKAVLQHNLLGASKLYNNIGIDQLGELLSVSGEKAEQYAAQMIEQGRLAGHIDQIDRWIFFEGEGSGERKTGHADAVVGGELRKWDANVQSLAEEVERVTSMIQNQYPVCRLQSLEIDLLLTASQDFYAANMVH
jgi:COP9 signalosome complex subunit 4